MEKKRNFRIGSLVILLLFIMIAISHVYAIPTDPTATYISNSTKTSAPGLMVNTTGNNSITSDAKDQAGSFIFTIRLTGETQNDRWKAYVGNVSGNFVLDDAEGYSLYSWNIKTSIGGEVYATRTNGSIDWTSMNCSNSTHITNEEIAMSHTNNPDDNISRTFNGTNNSLIYVGSLLIPADTCPTTNIYVNSTVPSNDEFEEVLLFDGSNLVYTTIIEDNKEGYRNGSTYDFQMILPEKGTAGWAQSTPYYFFVELT
ncbi:MAG: hypothetical protein KAK00_01235 [Nanoarchaeota archaeon]|nr:hypothetical protein [Nanoarchaeota archaeon]